MVKKPLIIVRKLFIGHLTDTRICTIDNCVLRLYN
jgi:hypothetical protein